MLALTKDSAYEICAIYDGDYNCLDTCNNPTAKIIYDTQKPNLCYDTAIKCENYILMPNEVCIETCDENIFTIIDDNNIKQCGLCRDLNKGNPYKLINTKKCFSSPPEGTKIINENLKLINCSDGYILKNDTCIVDKCNSHCKTCKGYSEDDDNQMCISCKENKVVLNGNCIGKCPERYFVKDNNCNECDNSCFSCSENPTNCTSCIDGEYLDESNHTCNNCTEHCKTCSKGLENGNENCLSCDLNSQYKFLVKAEGFDRNCVTGCPENTTLKKNECVGLRDDGLKQNDTLLYIFIIITAILLLLIMVCFLKNFCCKPKSHDEKLMKEINTELKIVIFEGKNNEIRRVMWHLGLRVVKLTRVQYGDFRLNGIPSGCIQESRIRIDLRGLERRASINAKAYNQGRSEALNSIKRQKQNEKQENIDNKQEQADVVDVCENVDCEDINFGKEDNICNDVKEVEVQEQQVQEDVVLSDKSNSTMSCECDGNNTEDCCCDDGNIDDTEENTGSEKDNG